MTDSTCIFCQIVSGKAPAFKIYEDKSCLAFLDIFPNTEAFTVVITKDHYPSNFAEVEPPVLQAITRASHLVAQKIIKAYKDVERCGLIFEGTEINHLHAKVIPMHQPANQASLNQAVDASSKYFQTYPGYLTTRKPSTPADVDFLRTVAQKINQDSPLDSESNS